MYVEKTAGFHPQVTVTDGEVMRKNKEPFQPCKKIRHQKMLAQAFFVQLNKVMSLAYWS